MRLSTDQVMAMLRRPADNDTLGGRIWRARDALGLTAQDLADRLGVRTDTVSAWERDRSEPRTNRLFMLAGVLGVTPAWLIAGIGEAPKDDLSNTLTGQLRDQLAQVKKLHEQTGKAICALEMELNRVLQDIQ
ncbi:MULTISPECIES: helix-turn-helix domain-containing protein [unclassified Rhizobium]|uniref:helix-turn-helix domain-containing protein n=1 Tax=unclassified Rhizobium TaxID=2613769 RepID=UPI0007145C8B|nr:MULTISPECIES: helix-turn-helix domain-containing protein [unclassified Rhizobium]KQS88265.1 transcriptional regulator [Rhizobium sp. Leaf391]KQS95328.1 transcriptional regulator [Rhizobium sp. Leaf386]KQT95680.1 transcriptional regulator [Rhizobium sp. Leaf453]